MGSCESLIGSVERKRAHGGDAAAQTIASTLLAGGRCVDRVSERDVRGITELRIKHDQCQSPNCNENKTSSETHRSGGRRNSLFFDGIRSDNHGRHLSRCTIKLVTCPQCKKRCTWHTSEMPSNMAMEGPNARVIGDETQNSIRATRDDELTEVDP
jgi:hypothetical protein